MKKIKYLGGAYYCDGLNAPYPLIIGKVYDVLHEGWHYKLNAENDAGSVYINKKYAEVVHIDEVETDNSLTISFLLKSFNPVYCWRTHFLSTNPSNSVIV